MQSDTAPIRKEERFDEDRVAEYLRSVIPDLGESDQLEFAQFWGGHANLTYVVRAGATEYVLRRPPLGDVAPGSHDMGREHRVLSVLHQAFPLAPRAIHYCDDASVLDKPFFVMERRSGSVIRGAWPEELDDALRPTVAKSFIDAVADLHEVDFETLGLADLGRPDGFANRQVAGWTNRWQRSREDDVPAMEQLAASLGEHQPGPQRASLIHNDLKLDNTMINDAGELIAVFDWDMSTIGDPLVDLGTTLAYWEGPPEAAVVVPPDGSVLGVTADEVIRTYEARTGLDCSDISWYRALASFRIAVILQQIYIRFRRGQTQDERFAPLGAVVPYLAAEGLRHLRA
jgi:aminoglycoside phosphotransferase (APT) family kinase protein